MTPDDEIASPRGCTLCGNRPCTCGSGKRAHVVVERGRMERLERERARYREALERLMRAYRSVFMRSLTAAMFAGDREFVEAWRAAEAALDPEPVHAPPGDLWDEASRALSETNERILEAPLAALKNAVDATTREERWWIYRTGTSYRASRRDPRLTNPHCEVVAEAVARAALAPEGA